jgi:hypothetical protein
MAHLALKDVLTARRRRAAIDAISNWWSAHRATLLLLACVVMGVFAALKLGDEFRRLLFEPSHDGAIDTRNFHLLVRGWFDGQPLYEELTAAVHPPATYVILWPFVGWLELTPARWLWALTSLVALGALVYLIVRESRADTRLEYLFVALLALSMNATGVTIGNGQTILHILPALLFGLLLLNRSSGRRQVSLLAAGLLLFTLLKPNISAPFLWIALFAGGGLLTVVFVVSGYMALTILALPFQESAPLVLAQGWAARAAALANRGGYANVDRWLAYLGLQEWMLWASLLVFVALGLWIYRYRKGDLWIMLGVTAIIARLWTYHRVYDDVLILLPMVALFRITKREGSSEHTGIAAGLLLAVSVLAMLAPARLEHFPWPWSLTFTGGHTLIWLAVLGFLLYQAQRDQKAEVE